MEMPEDYPGKIVEKIWGLNYKEHEHNKIVFSWEGVGRTVESIDPEFKGHLLSVIDSWGEFYHADCLVDAIQMAAWDFIKSGPMK